MDEIKLFNQHGFVKQGETGSDHIYGTCPFCLADRFYINIEKILWDCKKCMLSGNRQKFLYNIATEFKPAFGTSEMKKLKQLAKNKNVSMVSLRTFNVGYNPNTDNYILPIIDGNNDKMYDVRLYKGKKFMSSSGCKTGLFGWHKLYRAGEIWLCEGEWDAIALWQALQSAERFEDIVLAAPGAGTFKNEWHLLFKDRKVNVLYDYDDPGRTGAIKVYTALKSLTEQIKFIHWKVGSKKGYDVRDFFIDNGYESLNSLKKLLKILPQNYDGSMTDGSEDMYNKSGLVTDGKFIPPEEYYAAYRKYLYLPDTTVLDVIFGSVVANRFEGDPLWLFLVAPSGATKTELLMSISDAPRITTTTSLTPQSLISGSMTDGGDPSLIPRLNNKVLVIKDFTTILNMNIAARDEIFGILRDAYDGKTEKIFGNGIVRSHISKFGILAGVTPAIEMYMDGQTALGERFIKFQVNIGKTIADQRKFLEAAQKNINNELEMKKSLRKIGSSVLTYNFDTLPEISPSYADKIISLSQWLSAMRGTIIRDKYSKEHLYSPFKELGTRLVKQFTKLVRAIAAVRGINSVTQSEYNIIVQIAIGSVPSKLLSIITYLHKLKVPQDRDAMLKQLRINPIIGGRSIEDLVLLDMVVQSSANSTTTNFCLIPNLLTTSIWSKHKSIEAVSFIFNLNGLNLNNKSSFPISIFIKFKALPFVATILFSSA